MNNDLKECGISYETPLSALRARRYRWYALAVIVIEIFSALAVISSPLVQKILIDGVNAADRNQMVRGALLTAVLMGLAVVCQTGSYLLRFRLGVEIRCRLKTAVFHCLLGLPESFLKERGSSYFFNRLQTDTMEVVNFYSGNALLQFSGLLKFLLALSVIMFLHWKCALLLIPFLLMQYWLYRKYREKQYRLGHKIQECTASERSMMQDYLSGHTTLKTHNAAQSAAEKLDQGFARWRVLAFQRLFHENRFRLFLTVPFYVCCGGIAVYGLDQALRRQWTLGELWALLMLVRQVFTPVQRLAVAWFQMQQVQAAWDRLRQICHAADPDQSGTEKCCFLTGDIEFSHIRFSYTEDQTLFDDLNFTVKSKELCFLTGGNGTGKTTIFQLFLRLYHPLGGEIRIGGKKINDFPLSSYRSRIGYLGQTPEFFPGTVRDNLLLNGKHPDSRIMEVLKLLKSDHIIRTRPDGLDSAVTERGQNFSGGERLRLALARELLRDTDILLLDEPAANLDYQARHDFYELLPKLNGQRTVIVIIHDQPDLLNGSSVIHLKETAPGS